MFMIFVLLVTLICAREILLCVKFLYACNKLHCGTGK
jgi:hypothetical protein